MSQQYHELYQDFSANRSPGSTRDYSNGSMALARQPSRQFDNYAQQLQLPPLYTGSGGHEQRFDAPRFDRMGSATIHSNNFSYDAQTWNNYSNGAATTMGGTGRIKSQSRRAGLPTSWMESPQMPPPPMPNHHQMNGHYSQSHMPGGHHQRRLTPKNSIEEELIPTAIVIKNIPFNVKKEELVDIMTSMSLPLPYAFNYHFDSGVFRGLAFANFSSPEETRTVIDAMNHLDIDGRKLRVEYKKMLPQAERERIERDKRQRRGQLQEQHQPTSVTSLQHQGSRASLNSNNATSPSPLSSLPTTFPEIDLNDPRTLDFYTELMLFQKDTNRETIIFPHTITPEERRIIHILAHQMGLEHKSEGTGEMRQAQVFKKGVSISPPIQPTFSSYYNESRRGLNRAATIDFSEARGTDNNYYQHTLGRQGSGLLDIPGSPGPAGLTANHNLRAAKSFADLRSYTPSPVPSTASFPANLTQNLSRYAEYGQTSAASGTPVITPTAGRDRDHQLNNRDDRFVLEGLSNMTIGHDRPTASRTTAGPIGSQRPVNGNYDDNMRKVASAAVERQPIGPGSSTEWNGFQRPRQNGHLNRGSGELDLSSIQKSWDNQSQDSSDHGGMNHPTSSRYK